MDMLRFRLNCMASSSERACDFATEGEFFLQLRCPCQPRFLRDREQCRFEVSQFY